MGFYSFYKILKDMIRTLFGKKILKIIIILLLIFTIFFVYNECFAYELEPGFFNNNITFEVPSTYDGYNYVIIFGSRTNKDRVDCAVFFTSENEFRYNSGKNNSNGTKEFSAIVPANSYFSYDTVPALQTYSDSNTVQTYLNQSLNYCKNDYTLYNSTTSELFTNANNQQIFSNIKVYRDNEVVYDTFTPPSLSNTQSQLENLSFNNFIINANSFTQDMIANPDEPLVMLFFNRSLGDNTNTESLYPIKEKYFYKESIYFDEANSTDSNYVFNYPIFKSGVFFNVGSTYEIKLAKRVYLEEYKTWGYEYFDNSYVFTVSSNVTQDYINQLNQQTATTSDDDNQQQLQNSINQQTQSIDNINNSITDSTVDNSSVNLPTDNTNDPTQSGVDNIFQIIYNSFTSGTPQDIVFPIPNTNKNITLSANYVADSLRNNNASWVIDIIQAFYWYIISRYIIVDIMQKVRKIKQGNLDNIENSNIKEDML